MKRTRWKEYEVFSAILLFEQYHWITEIIKENSRYGLSTKGWPEKADEAIMGLKKLGLSEEIIERIKANAGSLK